MFVGFTGVSLRRSYALGVMVVYVLFSSALFGIVLFIYMSDFGEFQSFYTSSLFGSYLSDRTFFFFILFIFFAVKIPMFPFISWLPEAHVESNTEISILLAAIILKFAGFGFLRIHSWMDFDGLNSISWFAIALCLLGVVYGSFSSLHHLDMKKLIAYSSIVHMNLGLVCLFVNDFMGINVFVISMLIHGIVSTGLFYTVGFSSESVGSRHLQFLNTGIISTPLLSLGSLLIILLNIAVPLSIASIIEFMMLLLYESLGLMYLILGAVCAIWYCCVFSLILLHRVYMRDSSVYQTDIVDLGIIEIYVVLTSMIVLFVCILLV
jgi:NADH:ubiquinone oxidoreductase subunit 4 (subunit M)